MAEENNHDLASGKPKGEIISLEPVQLVFQHSAKEMAKNLTEYSQHLLEVAKQLQDRKPGQTFRIQIIHSYPLSPQPEITQVVNSKGGTIYHTMDCNGGEGGAGEGGDGGGGDGGGGDGGGGDGGGGDGGQ